MSACSSGSDEADEGLGSERSDEAEETEADAEQASDPDGQSGTDADDPGVPDDQGDDPLDPDPPFEPSISGEELIQRLTDMPGRLAIGNGPELAIARADGRTVEVLDGSESVLASQPTWSHDGAQLAWGSVSADRQVVLVQSFDEQGGRVGDPVQSNVQGPPVFYMQWDADDDRLAYIRNSTSAGLVEVGLIEPGAPAEPVGEGAPFFISWSPAPDRILAHVNETSIDVFGLDAEPEDFAAVTAVDGGFSAPAWADEASGLIVSEGALSYLNVNTGVIEPIIPLAGPVRFVLSHDRTKVAYQVVGGSGGVSVIGSPIQAERTGLVVLDLETGEQTVLTAELALAWEWSPDSDKLAWLGAELNGGRPIGRWSFWSNSDAAATTRSAPFELTRKYGRNYLPFFAQYAQSVTGWSPDSQAFAFAGTADSRTGIWIQLIDEVVAPQLVAPGDFVTWGPGEPPPPTSGGASAA